MMKDFYALILLLFCSSTFAQTTIKPEVPLVRQYFHEKIDMTQIAIAQSDGTKDSTFTPTDNDTLNASFTNALTVTVDSIQQNIEASKLSDNNEKIKYLRGFNDCLWKFREQYYYKVSKPALLFDLLNAFSEAMAMDEQKQSIVAVLQKHSYEAGLILVNSFAFSESDELKSAKDYLTQQYCNAHPDKIMYTLSKDPSLPYADSLIVVAAHNVPEDVYTYAAAYNSLADKIRSSPDSLVQLIAKLSLMKTGRMYFPFLDNIYAGKISFSDVETALRDNEKYYSLLVKTEIDYADQMRRRDTPLSMQALQSKLAEKAKEVYVNVINGLHESPDVVRFRKIQGLSAEELYYLAVMTEDEIYTSSYVRGVYPLIWKKMKSPKGDSLLMSVRFDHFKKWIKMAANYNTLNDFLGRMDKGNAQLLMKAFVNNLDKTKSLEDAVDVADSYGGVNDGNIRTLILNQVDNNMKEAQATGNKKAQVIYSILNTLFLSIDSSNNINLSAALGIPPVYFMPNKSMRDDKGRIIIQQFFYGDEDGKTYFPVFVNSFRNANWKITSNNQWVTVTSAKGIPVTIYSNKPLDEKQDLDAEAQDALNQYLYDNDLAPTMVIHRGHSYWLSSTLDQLSASAKLVMLGSCGAYQSLNKVLETCPSAQIISSKQTGAGAINQPMINAIVEELRQGKDLNWPSMWKRFGTMFNHGDLFDDYVAPYSNLGAVFIMAYTKKQTTAQDALTIQ